jgi:hypothetical protein
MRSTPPSFWTVSDDPREAAVCRLDRLHHRRDHAAVTDHVRVGEVDDREAVTVVLESAAKPLGNLVGGHLRFLVIGADVARARDEDPGLAGELVLLAAVEEVRHVRVLLGLGDVQLTEIVLCQRFGQRLVDILLAEGDRAVQLVAVARQSSSGRSRPPELL